MANKDYQDIVVETFIPKNHEHTDANIRVRPVEGQGYSTDLRVECSRSVRKNHPVGTKLRIQAIESQRAGGKTYLYSHHSWPVTVVEKPED